MELIHHLVFEAICHQLSDRCLVDPDVAGPQLCARCTGIYLGVLIGVLSWLPARRALAGWGWGLWLLLGLLVVPTPVEVIGERAAWWSGAPALRYALGLACGIGLSWALIQVQLGGERDPKARRTLLLLASIGLALLLWLPLAGASPELWTAVAVAAALGLLLLLLGAIAACVRLTVDLLRPRPDPPHDRGHRLPR